LRIAKAQLQRLMNPPYSIQSQIRPCWDLSEFVPTSRYTKATQRLARIVVASKTIWRLEEQNAIHSTYKQLWTGVKNTQVN